MDGLSFVLYLSIPVDFMGRNWTFGVYLDQRASQDEAQARGAILSGEGGGMFAALGVLIGTALPPHHVPISFDTEDGEHRISGPGLLEVGSERIPNPMPGEPPLNQR